MSKLKESDTSILEATRLEGKRLLSQRFELAKEFVQQSGLNANDGFEGLHPKELLDLGNALIDSRNIWDGYALMAQPTSSGSCYYDRVITPQHQRNFKVLSSEIGQLEQRQLETGLDVGAGTGESTKVLSQFTRTVMAIDLSPEMLAHADKKLKRLQHQRRIDEYKTVVMDALELGFPKNTFDIVIDNGMQAYMLWDEKEEYLNGVARVLVPGGRYYTYQAENPDPDCYHTSPRAELAQIISKALFVHSFLEHNRNTRYQDKPIDFQALGFKYSYWNIQDSLLNETVIRLTKI